MCCIIQPEIDFDQPDNDGKTRDNLKPDTGKDMYFECLRENYPSELNIVSLDCKEIIVMEKGRLKYNEMV